MTGFDFDLTNILPRLRAYALSLTRDSERADDLVQQTALKAMIGRKSFNVGTNFASWIFRIERNEFISELRRGRPTVDIDDVGIQPQLSYAPLQESGLIVRELLAGLRQLSATTRQALLLPALENTSLEEIAERGGVAIGTIKSRRARGRASLQHLLAA